MRCAEGHGACRAKLASQANHLLGRANFDWGKPLACPSLNITGILCFLRCAGSALPGGGRVALAGGPAHPKRARSGRRQPRPTGGLGEKNAPALKTLYT